MGSHYSVVQYTPDPAADERINIGVLAYSGETVRAKFVSRWNRIQTFGGEKVGFLKEFARDIQEAIEEQGHLRGLGAGKITEGEVRTMADEWSYAIRITPPRFSTKDPPELVEYIAGRVLKERKRKAQPRTRSTAARDVAKGVTGALQERLGDLADEITHRDHMVQGNVEPHEFDVVVANGNPLLSAEGFSFEPNETTRLVRNFEAILYSIEDVRQANTDIPIGMLALPPIGKSELWDRAQEVVPALGAEIVEEERLEEWADAMAEFVDKRL